MHASTIRSALVAIWGIMLLAPLHAEAQDWSRMFREPEVQNYQLTMDHVRKYVDVQRALLRDANAVSQLDREFKELQRNKPKPTLVDVSALVDRQAVVRSAINKTGLTTRDFLLTSWAVANAGIHLMIKRSKGAEPETAAQKANVALLESNQAEWKKLEQELAQSAALSKSKR